MKKKRADKYTAKRVVKCAAAVAVTFTIAFQPCFAFTSYAYTDGYDSYWDDYYSDSYYDGAGRKVTSVTKNYDDGTKYTAEYKYDSMGNLIYTDIKEADGSRSTETRSYNGDQLISETSYSYRASSKTEYTEVCDYNNGHYTHRLLQYKYSDGTMESQENWYLGEYAPLKEVTVNRRGITSQTDYTYNEHGKPILVQTVSSDGSTKLEEIQYDESGKSISSKTSSYNAEWKTIETEELRYEGEGANRTLYTLETTTMEDGRQYKEETWQDAETWQTQKVISTDPDGVQTTEDYTYDSDGNLKLYTKSDGSGIIEKRESTRTHTGGTETYSDSSGNSYRTYTSYDEKNGRNIREREYTYADGSYSYLKYVYLDDYSTESYIQRERNADGTESYSEEIYASDGSSITKEKSTDGTTAEVKKDAEGYQVSRVETLPDGTKSETTWERREDGRPVTEIKRYTDGSEDRIVYEYDQDGEISATTETRRNGVSAVTQYQEAGNNNASVETVTMTFSNGYLITAAAEDIDDETTQIIINYSAGEVAQQLVIENYDTAYVKTTYRDGRTEEFTVEYYSSEWSEKMEQIESCYDTFLDMAWGAQQPQNEAGELPAGETADGGQTV